MLVLQMSLQGVCGLACIDCALRSHALFCNRVLRIFYVLISLWIHSVLAIALIGISSILSFTVIDTLFLQDYGFRSRSWSSHTLRLLQELLFLLIPLKSLRIGTQTSSLVSSTRGTIRLSTSFGITTSRRRLFHHRHSIGNTAFKRGPNSLSLLGDGRILLLANTQFLLMMVLLSREPVVTLHVLFFADDVHFSLHFHLLQYWFLNLTLYQSHLNFYHH